jgi:uncharacterized protein YndB with AHSA1/START domain
MSDVATQPARPQVRWPERFLPARTQVFVQNEIVIPAPPARVWAWLIRAELWPTWYPNSAHIHFLSHAGPDLRNRSRFRWRTFGIYITSKVLEFEPCERLAWEAQGIGIDAYHGWVLTEQTDGSTHVISEESQIGWLASLGKLLLPSRKKLEHQRWLEALSRQVQTGAPPDPEPHR